MFPPAKAPSSPTNLISVTSCLAVDAFTFKVQRLLDTSSELAATLTPSFGETSVGFAKRVPKGFHVPFNKLSFTTLLM